MQCMTFLVSVHADANMGANDINSHIRQFTLIRLSGASWWSRVFYQIILTYNNEKHRDYPHFNHQLFTTLNERAYEFEIASNSGSDL